MLRSSRTRTYVVQSVIGVTLLYFLVVFSSSSWTGGITSSSVKQWADGEFSVLSTGGGSGGGSCGMCDVNPRLCEEYGGDNVVRSVSYMGSNHRLRRFLAKASRRQGFTVGLIGGSITAGHGLPRHDFTEKEPHRPNNLGRIIFDFLNERFPAPDGAAIGEEAIDSSKRQNVFVNGAQGGQGSEYFSKCFKQHIPEEADLVLVDASVNDQLFLTNMNSFEYMLRGLMDLPNNPAIIDIHLLALMFSQVALGGDLHFGILQEYDIPTISLRNTIYDETLRNKSALYEYFTHNPKGNMKDAEGLDLRHISWQGHQLAGNLTNTYLMTQMCEMERRGGYGDADKGPVHPLPRLLLMQKWDGTTQTGKFVPNCFTMMSSKDKLVPSENSGWREWAWENKKYIIADEPGSTIGFKFHSEVGQVELHHLKSATFGLGSVKCWVDNDEDKAVRADGYWKEPYNIGRGIRIRSDLKPGDHVLRCRLLKETNDPTGKHEFRIISVMSI